MTGRRSRSSPSTGAAARDEGKTGGHDIGDELPRPHRGRYGTERDGLAPERERRPDLMSTKHLLRRALLLPLLAFLAIGCVTDESAYTDRVATPRRSAGGAHGVGLFLAGASMSNHEAWLGRPVTHVGAYVAKTTWANFDRSSVKQWTGSGKQLVVGVPMLMLHEPGSLGAGARGAYDQHFRGLAQRLVREGEGNAILRVGWEFNGGWFPWRADRDPKAFAAYWRRIVTTMRSVPGAQGLRFDWNPGAGPQF